MTNRANAFPRGLRDGVPIALGYLAVSFAFGIQASSLAGGRALTPFQAGLLSLTNLTSAGQKAGLSVIAQSGTYIEIALVQLVINLRYLLMSTSLSQRLSPDAGFGSRLLVAYGVTDEIFAASVLAPAPLSPRYSYGLTLMGVLGWTTGTVLGAAAGLLLAQTLVNALGIALYGMFIAAIVPPARKDRGAAVAVLSAMALSALMAALPVLKALSEGMRVIIVAMAVSALCALVFPPDVIGAKEAR